MMVLINIYSMHLLWLIFAIDK